MLFGTRERHVKRILIVEDEPLVAFDNETMVAAAGYTVVATVDSVREALAVLEREAAPSAEESEEAEGGVDLILSDIQLTGKRTGIDLAAEAQARGIPLLLATANPPEVGDGNSLGVLCKPYNERRLKAALKMVEQILGGKAKVKAPDGVILYARPLAA
ncbi:response regulator [Sphingomonas kaistensis]|uniref:Response regulator n=1 Tax=Sphingomonas kaistensis TaxID=298708 RepID=A0ABZ2G609_9SPHN